MQTKYRNVLVTCPGNALTAGPEALHQLVADLNRLGQAASIVYFPFDKKFETPDPYKKYGAPVALFEDNNADLIIFPEIVTTYQIKYFFSFDLLIFYTGKNILDFLVEFKIRGKKW